ncbi:nicotinamide riboside transporter PnuC [Flavobacterium arcticum]|uniref:Nicotinamide riboside transporter PnuC n=1 Tax=Flavobacterium arcticum TaxID=1784713 RepID=A0A345HC12_9FLAO|nr:nicotinamide riboside transporter PnuC [Flavobacterium arcticum]AXG74122.1 nicotinamide riboside transporter PnuC [Flavobacterium arcticum]KAF2507318.1 nicotinamide mononucleotide transporter [Flavobacterium arcticum]
MNEILDFLFSQYKDYSTLNICLEAIASVFGALSVVYSARNSILVYPTGIVSTVIFTYMFLQWDLYGDVIISFYYFIMSIYGWMLWSRKDKQDDKLLEINQMTAKDVAKCIQIFIVSVIFVAIVFIYNNKFTYWWAYVDTFTTGLCFVGMWLLAKRKIENWIFLIIADIIAIPLLFYKGATVTSIFYIFLTIVAFIGYFSWKRTLQNQIQAS